MMKRAYIILIAVVFLVVGCSSDKPTMPDGDGIMQIVIVDTTGTFPGSTPGIPTIVDGAQVSLQARTHEYVDVTDAESGVAGFSSLPAGEYSLFARRELPIGAQKKVFTGFIDVYISGPEMLVDTIYVGIVTVNALMINEIYYAGGDYSKFYFYDQFVELYNSSQDTLYLDGCVLTRNFGTVDTDIEALDYVRAIYAFQFPGTPVTGEQYPIYPGQLVVVAADAIDHSLYAHAVDLSGADWEFFNPLGSDYDVPGVPNVVSIHPESGIDFLINVSHNAVVFTTGEEFWYESYINSAGYERIRVALPLYTVIDGVEYASNSDVTKELTARVDAGFAGLGCTKYSFQSTERREIGMDVNNSTFDFTLLPEPTPGWTDLEP
jgi:hypothetical protein